MNSRPIEVDAQYITEIPGLDPITVFWRNEGEGRGSVTLTCYGAAWTCYFGAMGTDTIQWFFYRADVSYLVNKIGIGRHLKAAKYNSHYLAQIIKAVKQSLEREEVAQ